MATATVASAAYEPTATSESFYGLVPMADREQRSLDDRVRAHIRKLSQTRFSSTYALAIHIHLSPSTFYKILSGERGVGIDVLKAMHDGLKTSADIFLDDNPEEQYRHPGPDESRRGRRKRGINATAGPPDSRTSAPGHGPNRKRGIG